MNTVVNYYIYSNFRKLFIYNYNYCMLNFCNINNFNLIMSKGLLIDENIEHTVIHDID